MSLAAFLDIICPNKHAFIKETWIQGILTRHLWMFASISNYVRKQDPGSNLSLLEIGTWMGSSLLTWGEGIAQHNGGRGAITCVDPLEPYFDADEQTDVNQDIPAHVAQSELLHEMDALLQGDFVYEIWKHNRKLIEESIPVNLLRESSTTALPKLRDESFDIIYIDGCHFYTEVLQDLKEAKRIVKPRGIICGDDLELKSSQCDLEFARANTHLDFPTDPKSGKQFHPGVTLAVGDSFDEVSLYDGFWMAQKTSSGFQPYYLDHYHMHIPAHFLVALRNITSNKSKSILRMTASNLPNEH